MGNLTELTKKEEQLIADIKAELEVYAKKGESHDIMDALRLLTDAYVDNCGISIGNRTMIYIAAERWFERLAWQDLPLSEQACTSSLHKMFPLFSSVYNKECHDEYDICGMQENEYIKCCFDCISDKEVDEQTAEVLAWGILDSLKEFEKYQIEVPVTLHGEPRTLYCYVCFQDTKHTALAIEPLAIMGIYVGLNKNIPELVEQIIVEYEYLLSKEEEIRALFPEYLKTVNESKTTKEVFNAFHVVYDELLGNIKYLYMKSILNDVFGLPIEY